MQLATGTVILSPEHHQKKYDLTPAECMILHRLHRAYANGMPLAADFQIQPGEAQTVEQDGKAAEDEYFNQNSGRTVPSKPAVPPVTHRRTQSEEIHRLQRKYSGNITVDGVAKPAFEATFGGAVGVRLPERFDEIEDFVGIKFAPSSEPETSGEPAPEPAKTYHRKARE